MYNTSETRMCTIKMKDPEGKFCGELCETESGGYIWQNVKGNLPPPKIDTSLFRAESEIPEKMMEGRERRNGGINKMLRLRKPCKMDSYGKRKKYAVRSGAENHF